LLLILAGEAQATHLIGGNLGYEFLRFIPGTNQAEYRVTLSTYIDCNSQSWGTAFPEPVIQVGVYEGTQNSTTPMPLLATLVMQLDDSANIEPPILPTCPFTTPTCIYIVDYEEVVTLPVSSEGYHIVYDRCCRPGGIINLFNPGDQALTFHAFVAPNSGPSAVVNSSPVFFDTLVAYICANDTTALLNTAIDPDGDILRYSLEVPHRGYTGNGQPGVNPPTLPPSHPILNPYTFPPPSINWQNQYNLSQPFGATGYAFIDPNNGYTEFQASQPGTYVIAVEIQEFRNGQLIGITRRDIQLLAENCPQNPRPLQVGLRTHPKATGDNTFSIQEGDSICFPIEFVDPNANQITLRTSGSIFLAGVTNPPANVVSPVTGSPQVSAGFCWQTACGQGNDRLYTFIAEAADDGCPPKRSFAIFEVEVIPTPDVGQIEGPDVACFEDRGEVIYTVPNVPGATYNWQVQNGTILDNKDTTITVAWNNSPSGSLSLTAQNTHGCIRGPSTKVIDIAPQITVDAGIDQEGCENDVVTIGPPTAGVNPNYSYEWNPSSAVQNVTDPTTQVTLATTQPLELVATDTFGCTAFDSMWLRVNPLPEPEISSSLTICEGDRTQLQASGGNSYRWSNARTLSNDSISNPVATPFETTTYTVTVTDSLNCSETASIDVGVQQFHSFSLEIDSVIFLGEQVTIVVDSDMELIYSWTPQEQTCIGCSTLVLTPDSNLALGLTIRDPYDCFQTDTSLWVEVIGDFAVNIPNAFTPNDDGRNGQFKLVTYGIKGLKEFRIYDRWGNQVFYTTDLNEGWNGFTQGEKAPANTVFVYKATVERYTGEELTYFGKVVLLY